MSIYTGSESAPPPWLAEASLAADWMALNPSPDEVAEIKKKGLAVVEVNPKVFNRDTHTDKVLEMPFFYGFDVGLEVSEDDVYKIEKILKSRKRRGKVEYFVKWRGYEPSFNSWTSDIFDA